MPDTAQGAVETLRARLVRAEVEFVAAERERDNLRAKLTAVVEHRPDLRESVRDRIERFLRLFAGLTFTPKELAEAVGGSDDAVKKALAYLVLDGFLVKTGHGTYAIDPHHGPSTWEAAKAMRNWEEP